MMKVQAKIAFIGLLSLLLTTGASAQSSQSIDSIVAVVEEDVILRSELNRAVASVLQQFAANRQPLPQRDILERQVLERLTLVKLELQRADQTGIRVSDQEVDQAIQNVARSAGLTQRQMRQTIQADGMSWQQFRNDMADELKTQQLKRRVANSRVNVTETEVDIFLQSNELNPGEYRLSHILIGVPEGATPDQVQSAREEAEKLHADLVAESMDFATAAITFSDGQNALQGGDLGWRPGDEVPTLFADQIKDMNPGDLTRPMRSASGFHLLKVTDFREKTQKMIAEVSARHLMIEVSELIAPQEALDIITNLHQRLTDGEDFGELARQYSDDTTSANLGGEMGWFQPGAFGQRTMQVLSTLADGEISQPFQTVAGWHIFQKIGEREQDRTEEILRAQARESLRRQKAEEELQLWERQLRDESFVEYRISG
jgi:peptidyl-prolyl cis-trans isomerase SurA